jgi:hypothetical protein
MQQIYNQTQARFINIKYKLFFSVPFRNFTNNHTKQWHTNCFQLLLEYYWILTAGRSFILTVVISWKGREKYWKLVWR